MGAGVMANVVMAAAGGCAAVHRRLRRGAEGPRDAAGDGLCGRRVQADRLPQQAQAVRLDGGAGPLCRDGRGHHRILLRRQAGELQPPLLLSFPFDNARLPPGGVQGWRACSHAQPGSPTRGAPPAAARQLHLLTYVRFACVLAAAVAAAVCFEQPEHAPRLRLHVSHAGVCGCVCRLLVPCTAQLWPPVFDETKGATPSRRCGAVKVGYSTDGLRAALDTVVSPTRLIPHGKSTVYTRHGNASGN